jgi:hypothetical protein
MKLTHQCQLRRHSSDVGLMVPSLETTMSERTRELTEAEIDAVSGGFTSSEHWGFDAGDMVRVLGEIMAGVQAASQTRF